MGLDVYLYRYDDFDAYTKYENDRAETESAVWKKHYKGEDSENGAIYDRSAIDADIKVWEAAYGVIPESPECVELPSSKYPEHLFRIGYFRSSYNGAGTNSVLRESIGIDLYDIFSPGNDYTFKPNWAKAMYMAQLAKEKFAKIDYLIVNKDHYDQAIEIVIETIQYVLNQPHPEQYALHWSS